MTKAPRVVKLMDSSVGSSALIHLDLGFNCFSFITNSDGESIETLWAAAGFEEGDHRASGSGIPLLFPFPGRIGRAEVRWQDRSYPLEPNDGRGNAIHGFVHTRPWRLLEQDTHFAKGQFQASVDDPSLLQRWPADFRITARYQLNGNTLDCDYLIDNPDDNHALPCGFGTHPYFRVPLGGEDAADCRVTLPVTGEWELNDLVPTGEYRPVRDTEMFREGLTFGEMNFDNVFGGLEYDADGWCRCTITDPSSQRRLIVAFERPFRECVVYTPGNRESVCIEPYTCAPNMIALHGQGIDAGLIVLAPGQSLHTRMRLSVE